MMLELAADPDQHATKPGLPAAEVTREVLSAAAPLDEKDVVCGLSVCRSVEGLDTEVVVGEPVADRRQQADLVGCQDADEGALVLAAVHGDDGVADGNEVGSLLMAR